MKFMEFVSLVKNKAEIVWRDHGPEIALGAAGVSFLAGTALAVHGTIKAVRAYDAAKEEMNVEALTTKDLIKTVWKYYVPTAGLDIFAIVCLIGSGKLSADKIASLAAALGVSQETLKAYREETKKALDEGQYNSVEEKVNQDMVDAAPVNSALINGPETRGDLFYCTITGRVFRSDKLTLMDAAIKYNHQVTDCIDYEATLNDFYSYADREDLRCHAGEYWGNDINTGTMSLTFTPCSKEIDGVKELCWSITYENMRAANFGGGRFSV